MSTCKLCPPGMEGCHLCCESGPHHFIPQRPYVCRQGARREGIYEAKKVAFRKGNQCGILVGDAVLKRYEGLENRDSRPFEGIDVADQGTLRIEWPGYPSWNSTFRTRGHSTAKTPVTLSRLATDVCNSIKKFVEEMEEMEKKDWKCTEPNWRVGSDGCLNIDTLMLVSVERASHGSWKASIRLL